MASTIPVSRELSFHLYFCDLCGAGTDVFISLLSPEAVSAARVVPVPVAHCGLGLVPGGEVPPQPFGPVVPGGGIGSVPAIGPGPVRVGDQLGGAAVPPL